jgi:mannose-1-phosphate guanylyltransferase
MNSSNPEPTLWAVVLAGGIGSRFWPASTPARPKQLLPLASERPLITDTVDRILPLVPAARVRLLAGDRLAQALLTAVPALGPESVLAEPRARGTAPALAWAAAEIARADPAAVMISLHADHVIEPPEAFRGLLAEVAAAAAAHRRLFTIGAVPTRAETGYGYICPGALLEGGSGREVARFVEKPDRATAERYVADGYLWNTGIFVWPAALLLDELRRHTPELVDALLLLDDPHLDAAERARRFFDAAPSLSIDEGLLERSDRVAVVEAAFRWDDVGAWDALGRTRPPDDDGNSIVGNARLVDSKNCIVWSEEGAVVAYGVEGLVMVRVQGITFIAPRDRAADLKQLLAELPADLRDGVPMELRTALPRLEGEPIP